MTSNLRNYTSSYIRRSTLVLVALIGGLTFVSACGRLQPTTVKSVSSVTKIPTTTAEPKASVTAVKPTETIPSSPSLDQGVSVTPTATSPSQPQVMAVLPVEIPFPYGPIDSHFAWRPDGAAIAYAGRGGLWLAEAPDFSPRLLVPTKTGQLVWSPDGSQIAFVAERSPAVLTIRLIKLQTNSVEDAIPVNFMPKEWWKALNFLDWPDDHHLIFQIHCGTECEYLYSLDPIMGEVTPLVTYPPGKLAAPLGCRYFPSPTQDALVVFGSPPGCQTRLGVFDIPRETFTPLSEFPEERHQAFASWAPSGQTFLYYQWTGRDNPVVESRPDLYLWNRLAGKGRLLIPGVWQASWSPNGRLIAFILLGNPTFDNQGRIIDTDFVPGQPATFYLGLMDATMQTPIAIKPVGQITDLDRYSAALFYQGQRHLVWSPDGRRIAYQDIDGVWWWMSSDGQASGPITAQPGVERIAWSSTGDRLALAVKDELRILTMHPVEP